jgi:hypothetical protein
LDEYRRWMLETFIISNTFYHGLHLPAQRLGIEIQPIRLVALVGLGSLSNALYLFVALLPAFIYLPTQIGYKFY